VLGVVAFIVYALTAGYPSITWDVVAANLLSWQIATHGNPYFDLSTVPELDDNSLRAIWVVTTETGHDVIGRSPGAVALAVPLYWVLGGPWAPTAGALTAALLTAVTVVLLHRALLTQVSARLALVGALAVAFTTPVWTVAADGMWPHTVTILGIAGMAWAAATDRWWLAGVFGGIVLWGRLHAALLVAVAGLFLGWQRRDARIPLKVGLVSALFLALQCCWTRWAYDSWNPMASYDTGPFQDFASRHGIDLLNHAGMWISPDRGLLVWTPVLLVLIPHAIRHWRSLPDWSRALAWGGVAYTLLQGTLNRFSGGDAFFGYRISLELLVSLAPALTIAAQHLSVRMRRVCAVLIGIQFVAMTVGALRPEIGMPAELVWQRNALVHGVNGNWWALGLLLALGVLIGLLADRMLTHQDESVVMAK
jgi:alpha-1,2-mannosyltransferase